MSLIGLVNLAERLFNQTQGNLNEDAGEAQRTAKAAAQTQRNGSDEFRPSGGSAANEAGLFQVTQQTVFTGAAAVLLVQPSGTTTGGADAAAAAPAVSVASATPASGAANSGGSAAADVASASTQSADNAQVLAQLQSLNTALATLGLGANEIAAVDRVAQLIRDFSPAAFASLISQLQTLAQDSAPPAATSANTANTPGAQSGGGFSIQELSINFAGVNETAQQGGNTLQISAFELQVNEVNLTLNNATTGQTAQIQAPLQTAPNAAGTTAPVAKAATA